MKVNISVLVRGEIGPIEIEMFVLIVSLKNQEEQNTKASDMGSNPLHS